MQRIIIRTITKNPIRYKFYRSRSGRDKFINETWQGKEDKTGQLEKSPEELKKRLTPLQYDVTQKKAQNRLLKTSIGTTKKRAYM